MAIETETAIHGFIASEPRLSFTQRSDARLYARVGRDRSEMSETGSRIDLEPDFHDLIMWGRSAERASEVLAKGDCFIAQGHVVAGERVIDGRTEPTEALVARRIGPDLNMMKVARPSPRLRSGCRRRPPSRRLVRRWPNGSPSFRRAAEHPALRAPGVGLGPRRPRR
jgi:single-stranded DNA-binding protein